MNTEFNKLKPGVSRNGMLLVSAALWTAMGCFLLLRGLLLFSEFEGCRPAVLAVGLLAGILKSRYILDKVAAGGIRRINSFQDGICLGAVYSISSWCVVLFMALLGIYLRNSSVPVRLVSLLLLMVGCALVYSSRLVWVSWYKQRKMATGPSR